MLLVTFSHIAFSWLKVNRLHLFYAMKKAEKPGTTGKGII